MLRLLEQWPLTDCIAADTTPVALGGGPAWARPLHEDETAGFALPAAAPRRRQPPESVIFTQRPNQ